MIEDSLFSFLTSDPGVSALIDDRMYENILQQNVTLPAIHFTLEDTEIPLTMQGEGQYVTSRFNIRCVGSTAVSARTVRDTVHDALRNLVGDMAGITIRKVVVTSINSRYDDDMRRHQSSLFIDVHHLGGLL